jgi:putative membrane protein
MSKSVVAFLQRWLVTALAVLVAANLVKGIAYDSIPGLLVASLLLGFLNAFVRPVLVLLSLPLLVSTLGLIYPVINALMLWLVGSIVKPFHVDGFWPAFWGALVIGIVSFFGNLFFGVKAHVHVATPGQGAAPKRPAKSDDGGTIIDV